MPVDVSPPKPKVALQFSADSSSMLVGLICLSYAIPATEEVSLL
jgi:uncharacterized membrane protein